MLKRSTTAVVGLLSIGLLTNELRVYDSQFRPFSICLFQAGICDEQPHAMLPEGRLNFQGLTSTSSSAATPSITAGLTGQEMTAIQGEVRPSTRLL
jgi:hypothetical protein